MRRLVLKVHLLLAVIAGAFIVVLGATGSVIAFEPELDHLAHPHLSYISPGGKVLPLQQIGATVSQKFGGEPVVAFLPSTSPDVSAAVVLPRGIVYVNPYTGEVLGLRTRGQTIIGFARAVHVRLGAGDLGKALLRWSGVALLFSLASGLYLWWPAKRIRIRDNWKARGFWFDLHNTIGVVSFLPLLVLAATGTIIGFEDQAASLIAKVTASSEVHTSKSVAIHITPVAVPITPDEAVAIACAQLPGTIAYRVQMPRYGSVYRVSLSDPEDRVAGDRNQVAIDPHSGDVVSSSRSSDLSTRERILATNEAIHTGEIWGLPSKIVAWLASVILPVQSISGLLIWLCRKRDMPVRDRVEKGAAVL